MNFKRNIKWIAAAALTLGTSAFVPAFAQAGRIETHETHDRGVEHREVRVEHNEHFDRRDHFEPRERVEHVERIRVEPRIEVRRVVVRQEPAPIVYVRIGGLDIPRCVVDTANAQCDGRTITTVQRGFTNGVDCYIVRECGAGRPDLNLSIGLDGRLLSVSQVN